LDFAWATARTSPSWNSSAQTSKVKAKKEKKARETQSDEMPNARIPEQDIKP
jgi:uncharacterized protein YdaU (DUF1376 family)